MTNVPTSDRRTRKAFLGEVGAAATLGLGDTWKLRGEYRAMFVEGVALASGQVPAITTLPPMSGIDPAGGVFYHGGFLGLEAVY